MFKTFIGILYTTCQHWILEPLQLYESAQIFTEQVFVNTTIYFQNFTLKPINIILCTDGYKHFKIY